MEKPEESDTASELEHRHGNSVVGFECARLNRSIIIMQKEKAPIYKLSRSKAPKHSKFAITDMHENPAYPFSCKTRASTLAPAIISQTQFLCKIFRSCRIYNSLVCKNQTLTVTGFIFILSQLSLTVAQMCFNCLK